MQNELTKNLRTHIIYIQELGGNGIEEIHVTRGQERIISEDIDIGKKTDFYTIRDIDNPEIILFKGQKRDILRSRKKQVNTNTYYMICKNGNIHNLKDGVYNCKCLFNEKKSDDISEIMKNLGISQEYKEQIITELGNSVFNENIFINNLIEFTYKKLIKSKN